MGEETTPKQLHHLAPTSPTKPAEQTAAGVASDVSKYIADKMIGNGGILLIDDNKVGLPKPAGLVYNIVQDFPWTLTESSNRSNVPYIKLTEYEITLTALWMQLEYWLKGTYYSSDDNDNTNPYQFLYHAEPTGYVFKIPYFENYDHAINPQWDKFQSPTDADGLISSMLGTIAKVGQLLGVAPGSKINQPQVFGGASQSTYSVKFTLYNTTGLVDTDKIIQQNMDFKRRLQMSTLHSQMTRLFISPPAIFEVHIPGIRYSPAAIISNLTVSNIGQMNLMNISGRDENIPDAYEFNIQITELIVESREILRAEYMNTQSKIKAIITPAEAKALQKKQKT